MGAIAMWNPWKNHLSRTALLGCGALGLGITLIMAAGQLPQTPQPPETVTNVGQRTGQSGKQDSQVVTLALKAPSERTDSLLEIAQATPSPDQARARYLLASDLVAQGQGGQALPLLEGLADVYPPLAAPGLVLQGKAERASGQLEAAQQTWATVWQTYQDHPVAAEALFQLGQTDPTHWEDLLQFFPAHPRSVEVAHKKLVESPDRPNEKALLLVMTRHGVYHPQALTSVNRLVENYGEQLSPQDWQAVGFAYWERQSYQAAGEAYSKAPATPQNRYRAARGLQIGGQRAAAIAGYYALNAEFPDAPETATGLLRLANLVDAETALELLDQVTQRFPEQAAEALLAKAQTLDALNSSQTATQLRETILTQYSTSETAADMRARYARNAGASGNWSGALRWIDALLKDNQTADVTPEIAFWGGKWALKAGLGEDAIKRFEQVVRDYPESYYAWRSAVALGWDVGDFHTVRSYQPAVALPAERTLLPVGSETLQELYLLGQDWDAWATWQVEFTNPQAPTVEEQFTDGVLRLGVGDNLDGIFMVSSLSWRDTPEERATYKTIKQHPAYGQTLYPFPFAKSIAEWSSKRSLNPLLVTALIRQESRFEPQIRSVVGAAGLMQVMPDTAAWIQSKTGIPDYDLDNPESNIELGTWYLDYTHEEYRDHSLFAVASYNAGPGNVADWIARQNYADADEFVDKIPFPETKDYVMSVFGGYWNYLRLYNPEIAQRLEKYRSTDAL